MSLSKEAAGRTSLSQLPTRCLEQVLQRLPLTNVFQVMRVSREWYVAAATVLREWRVLVVFDFEDQDYEIDEDTVRIHAMDDVSAVVASLTRMQRLHCLYFQDMEHEPLFDALVQGNASTLRELQYPLLPLAPGLRYPLLQLLVAEQDVGQDAAAMAAAMPNIQKLDLMAQRTCALVQHVVCPEKMLRLAVQVINWKPFIGFQSLVQALLSMKQLQELSVLCDDMRGQEEHVMKLFCGFRCLTSFELDARKMVQSLDSAVAHLVTHNPRLKDVTLSSGGMTDETLHQLAKLKSLTSVSLTPNESGITTDGVCALLTGSSRFSLQSVTMDLTSQEDTQLIDGRKVRSEIKRLAQEVGKKVKMLDVTRQEIRFTLTPP